MKKHSADSLVLRKAVDVLASLAETGACVRACMRVCPSPSAIHVCTFPICHPFFPPTALSDAGLKANRAYSYVLAALKNHLLDVDIQTGGLLALSHLLKTGLGEEKLS